VREKVKARRKKRVLKNEITMVRIHHNERKSLLCIKNKIWNGNADTWLVKALASFKLKRV
jgi:hypothetical protein